MREIKFRAWDSISRVMWEDVYFDAAHIYTIGIDGEYASTMPRWDDNALMQYIGLKDKNGKEIYEGDILLDENGHKELVVFGQIGFDSALNGLTGFACHSWARNDFYELEYMFDPSEIEVIGNKYENPELMVKISA